MTPITKPGEADLTDDSTAVELWAEIWRLRAAIKGPDGYASWQDAATDERIRRVRAERALAALGTAPATQADVRASDLNTGHGHVFPRPDGMVAKCGGPPLCMFCKGEASRL